MKLWLIYQTENTGYDTYDSAVVAAETEDEARKIHPGGAWDSWDAWVDFPERVSVLYLGEASDIPIARVILASFNAG